MHKEKADILAEEVNPEELSEASAQRLLLEAQATIAHLEEANDKYIEHNKALQSRLKENADLYNSTVRTSKKIISAQQQELKGVRAVLVGLTEILSAKITESEEL